MDYSSMTFSQGIVCLNTNNNQYCVVIGDKSRCDNSKCSLVMEMCGKNGYMLHTPPNAALVPTGRVINLEYLAVALKQNLVGVKWEDDDE